VTEACQIAGVEHKSQTSPPITIKKTALTSTASQKNPMRSIREVKID